MKYLGEWKVKAMVEKGEETEVEGGVKKKLGFLNEYEILRTINQPKKEELKSLLLPPFLYFLFVYFLKQFFNFLNSFSFRVCLFLRD